MRGDSVRDLYAKTLALMGLAVLAGAGALVDYWPVQGSLPVVSFAFSLPSIPAPLDARVALTFAVATPPTRPRASAPALPAEPVTSARQLPIVTVPDDESVATLPVAAPASEAELPATLAQQDKADWTASDVDLSLPTPGELLALSDASHVGAQAGAPRSGILQRTGGQILNVGLAVGTGVAKGFSAMGTALNHIGHLLR